MQKTKKRLGALLIIPTIVLLAWTIIFFIFMTLWGIGSGGSISGMIFGLFPLMGLTLVKLVILIFLFYLAVRLIKEKPFQNNILAIVLIIIGIVNFVWQLVTTLINNITGFDSGGELRLIITFLWGFIFVVAGISMRAIKKTRKK